MFSAIIVVLQFCHAWQAATVVAAVLCFFAGLEAFLNFCAGGWWGGLVSFGWGTKSQGGCGAGKWAWRPSSTSAQVSDQLVRQVSVLVGLGTGAANQ